MDFWLNFGLFALKATTILILVAVFLILIGGLIGGAKAEAKREKQEKLKVKTLNDTFEQYREKLETNNLSDKAYKQYSKDKKKQEKLDNKAKDKSKSKDAKSDEDKPNLYVVKFDGDISASEVSSLREIISALVLSASSKDEVVLHLESGGGTVHGYGLAASQLARLRDKNIPLTITIDKVAASGGYMMAAVGNKILASPFAIIGSIGVVASLPNFNEVLKKNDIKYEQFTAGKYKRTVTMFGENTDAAREKVTGELEQVLVHFKSHIQHYRPQVDVDEVATGEYWHAIDAQKLNLVDELQTSDDYILSHLNSHNIVELSMEKPKSLLEKVSGQVKMIQKQWLPTRYQ